MPSPSLPIRFSRGTWQSRKISSPVSAPRSPSLCSWRPALNPGVPFLDDERADPFRSLAGLGDRDHRVAQMAVGDEALAAVQHVAVGHRAGRAGHAEEVRAAGRLGDGAGAEVVAAAEGRQVLRLLRVAAELGQGGGAHVVDLQADADGRRDPADLLDGDRARQVPEVRAAVLGGRDQSEDADLARGPSRAARGTRRAAPSPRRAARWSARQTHGPTAGPAALPGQIEIHGDLVR